MKDTKCPYCKKKIDVSTEICPHCNEMIFYDVIVSEQTETDQDNHLDKIKKVINKAKDAKNMDDSNDKEHAGKKAKLLNKITSKFSVFKKKIVDINDKYKNSKIYPYVTYQNVLCIITVIATVAMVGMGIKIAKFTDNTSVVSKVNDKTTYQQVENMQKKEKVDKRLDLKRGLIIMIYENQKYAGIKSTVIYEVVPKTDKVNQTIIKFPYSRKDVDSMKRYLEVNYGYGKKNKDGTLSYSNDEVRYNFTNGISAKEGNSGEEIVEIIPLNKE